jgi:hypothetical protein
MGISTFAWFTTKNPGPNEIDLKSGDNAVTLDVLAYKNGYSTDGDGDPVEAAYNKDNGLQLENATKASSSSNEAAYVVTFNSDTLSAFKYANSSGALYDDELSMAEKNFPHLYVELRYTKPTLDGFVKASVSNINFAADTTSYTNITESLGYQYRFVTEKNTSELPYKNGMRAAYADATYTGSNWTTLSTTGFSLYSSADTTGYSNTTSSTLSDQCYVPSFARTYDGTNYYYSKSTLLEVRINPLKWMSYFRSNTSAYENQFSFGVSFSINFEYSNQPFFTSSTAPRIVATPSEVQMAINEESTSTALTVYNFSATPTYAVTSSDENLVLAMVATDGSYLDILTGTTAGTAYLYVTASAGTETATTTVTITIYDGPTLVISPTGMTIDAGKSASIATAYMGFSSAPTISAVSSSTAVATVSVSGSSVLVTGVEAGTTNVTITATNGTQTSTKTCTVTVLAQTATLVSIEVTTKPLKLEYQVGDTLDTTGCVVTATWSNATTSEVTSSCTFSPTTIASQSDTTITVTYRSATTTFTITVSTSVYNSTTYKLITSANDLVAGAKYVIIGDNTGSGLATGTTGYAMSTVQNANNRGSTSLDILATTPTSVEISGTVETFTLGGVSNAWTLQANRSSATGYLNPASGASANVLRTVSSIDTYSYWTIGITSGTGVASIVNNGKSSRNILRFNYASNNLLFSCYSTGNSQRDVYLFKQDTTNEVERIAVKTLPIKTTYTVGDAFASAGLTLTVYWTNGTTTVISDGFSLSPANGDTLANVGTQTVSVTYGGKSTSFDLTVEPRVLSSIEVTSSPTTDVFYVDDALDFSGLVVTAYYTNSSQSVVTSFCTCSPATGTTVTTAMIGTLTDMVTYTENGITKTTSFILTIRAAEVDHITISSTTGHVSAAWQWFATNEPFNVTGLVIKAVFANYSSSNDNSEYFSASDYGTGAGKKFYTDPAVGTVLSTSAVSSYLINVYLTENPARHVSYHVAVYDPALSAAPTSLTINGGATGTVALTETHFANQNANVTNWTFASNNSAIATSGMSVTGTTLSITAGYVSTDTTGTVTATGTDSVGNAKSVTISVTVKAPTISLSPASLDIGDAGTATISVVLGGWSVTPTVTAAIVSGSAAISNATISGVTQTGATLTINAAAVSADTEATIRVTAAAASLSVSINASVTATVRNATLSLSANTLSMVGGTTNTSITATWANFASVTPTFNITSSNTGVITGGSVSSSGVVTLYSATVQSDTTITVTITATSAGVSRSQTLTVTVTSQSSQTSGTVTYTSTSSSGGVVAMDETETGDAWGGTASCQNTYTSTFNQITRGNSLTYTINVGSVATSFSQMVLSMHSNSSKGAGYLQYSIDGGTTWVDIVSNTAAFNTSSWYGAWTTSFVNVTKTFSATAPANGTLMIKLTATTNSLYCTAITLSWTRNG